MNKKTKILFFGTPEFAVSSLQTLIDSDFNVVGVVAQPDKPVGRKKTITPSPVKILAEKNKLQIIQPETFKDEGARYIDEIKSLQPDLFVIVAYGKILPQNLLDMATQGSVNVHPSLLPKYRGPSPLQAQILAGESEVGVSIMLIDEEMDHGPILARLKIKDLRLKNHNYESLGDKFFNLAAKNLPQTIDGYLSGELKPEEQNHSQATITKLIKKEDGEIDWSKSAEHIERMTRAYSPWPGAFGKFINYDLGIKILKASISNQASDLAPGTAFKTDENELGVVCGVSTTVETESAEALAKVDGYNSILIIDKIQPEGKQVISGKEFVRGYLK